jgi:signal transduction histidine kinase
VSALRGVLGRLGRPKTTVRWRLALLYGGLFLASGVALLVITYTLVSHATTSQQPRVLRLPVVTNQIVRREGPGLTSPKFDLRAVASQAPPSLKEVVQSAAGRAVVRLAGSQQRISDLHQLEIESAIALAIMAVLSGGLGWLVAGRVLRPLRTITAATQQISEANLHERLALEGPDDELKQLAETIDGLLQRLEGAFDAQRRFVANASHELRTPLSAERAMLELVMSDDSATVETFREVCAQVLDESERQEQLIEALLTLAQGQRGLAYREPVDLTALVAGVVERASPEIAQRGLRLAVALEPAWAPGDPRLLERLVSNLVDNAIAHNVPAGRVHVRLRSLGERAELRVENTGPHVPGEEVGRLLAPFQRLGADRVGHHRDGLGLGLSIVAAIATSHNAALTLEPRPSGGLDVTVTLAGERPPHGETPALEPSLEAAGKL